MKYSIKYFIRRITFGLLFLTGSIIVGCTKLVSVDPPYTSVNAENVYQSDATAISTMTGLYAKMSLSTGGVQGASMLSGLSADELTLWDGVTNNLLLAYFRNKLSAIENTGTDFWSLYSYVYRCNEIIEGVSKSNALIKGVRDQLLGEAKFTRAYLFFQLVNYFGEVPLTLTTDYKVNAQIKRSSTEAVYDQIKKDLLEAITLLSKNYLNGSLQPYAATNLERVRPTYWAVKALQARVFLYTGDYINAELMATEVIDQTGLFSLESLNNVFIKSSKEAIWQLQPVTTGRNTDDAVAFVIPPTGPSATNPAYLSDFLLESFEVGDERKVQWIGSVTPANPGTVTYFFPYKYKVAQTNAPVTEYPVIFRLAEQYLIRAEARAWQNKIAEAQVDLNAVRHRAGLGDTPADDGPGLVNAVLQERKAELFTEYGHRWFDLKRTHTINQVMQVVTPVKSDESWQSYQALYPLPLYDLTRNNQLEQNDGYQ
jgi:hypothetical protein